MACHCASAHAPIVERALHRTARSLRGYARGVTPVQTIETRFHPPTPPASLVVTGVSATQSTTLTFATSTSATTKLKRLHGLEMGAAIVMATLFPLGLTWRRRRMSAGLGHLAVPLLLAGAAGTSMVGFAGCSGIPLFPTWSAGIEKKCVRRHPLCTGRRTEQPRLLIRRVRGNVAPPPSTNRPTLPPVFSETTRTGRNPVRLNGLVPRVTEPITLPRDNHPGSPDRSLPPS